MTTYRVQIEPDMTFKLHKYVINDLIFNLNVKYSFISEVVSVGQNRLAGLILFQIQHGTHRVIISTIITAHLALDSIHKLN